MSELKNRYDFVLVFDVQDGNPNGDPDAGNMPRTDVETGFGLVSDVCLKRKVRNYVQLVSNSNVGYDIFIKEKAILNKLIEKSYEDPTVKAIPDKEDKRQVEAARKVMCQRYYDVRTFGAVMSTGDKETDKSEDSEDQDNGSKKEKNKKTKNAGQVRGPVQMTFARSVDRVNFLEHTITRVAVTKEKDLEKEHTMGQKYTIPYALYISHGFVSPQLAKQTEFTEEDLTLFFKALVNMFDYDHSAARGMMATRRLIVFKHADPLGNAPAWKLFDLVHAVRKNGVENPRSFSDYDVTVDAANCPANVEIQEFV